MTPTKKTSHYNWRPFEEAREYVRSLKLKSQAEWNTWAKSDARPKDIPVDVYQAYKDEGWTGMGEWLGTGRVAKQDKAYRPFEEARALAHSLGLKNRTEWSAWAKIDAESANVPSYPDAVYKNQGWSGWGDWLGTGVVATQNRIYRPFETARAFACSLELKSVADWKAWAKTNARPDDIPANPRRIYLAEGWNGWGDWLGTGAVHSAKSNLSVI